MDSNGSLVNLADVADIVMGQSPKGDTYNYSGEGAPLLNGPTEFGSSHPTPVLWTTVPTRYCKLGDLLFCVRGSTTGRMNWADREYCIGRGVGAFRAKSGPNDTRFIYYTFVHQLDRLLSLSAGSVFPNLSRKDFATFEIPWPDFDTRSRAVKVLGSLDDKIELNRRMNETLEELARALFKSWFVDFDPVRAKIEGRQPIDVDDDTAALFPDSFEDSPLGEIPTGWSVEPLDQIARFLNGLALQKYPPEGDEYLPAIKIAELRKGVTSSSGRASTNVPPQYVVEDGDVLFSWSGSLEVQVWTGGRGALNQHLFKVTSERYPKWFYYYWIKQHLTEFRAIAADKATTMGHIKRHHLTDALTVVPSEPVLHAMSTMMEPIVIKLLNNNLEARTLATIRDALLPKLLSGEVRVGGAEAFAEDGVR